jgi:hypothetical protein
MPIALSEFTKCLRSTGAFLSENWKTDGQKVSPLHIRHSRVGRGPVLAVDQLPDSLRWERSIQIVQRRHFDKGPNGEQDTEEMIFLIEARM